MGAAGTFQSAGYVRRSLGFAIDLCLAYALSFPVGLGVGYLIVLQASSQGIEWAQGMAGLFSFAFFALAAQRIFWPLYFAVCWMIAARTPGQWLVGARVARSDGVASLPPMRSIVRAVAMFWPAIVFIAAPWAPWFDGSAAFFWGGEPLTLCWLAILAVTTLAMSHQRGLHDRAAGSRVVRG